MLWGRRGRRVGSLQLCSKLNFEAIRTEGKTGRMDRQATSMTSRVSLEPWVSNDVASFLMQQEEAWGSWGWPLGASGTRAWGIRKFHTRSPGCRRSNATREWRRRETHCRTPQDRMSPRIEGTLRTLFLKRFALLGSPHRKRRRTSHCSIQFAHCSSFLFSETTQNKTCTIQLRPSMLDLCFSLPTHSSTLFVSEPNMGISICKGGKNRLLKNMGSNCQDERGDRQVLETPALFQSSKDSLCMAIPRMTKKDICEVHNKCSIIGKTPPASTISLSDVRVLSQCSSLRLKCDQNVLVGHDFFFELLICHPTP